jgi:hypothetical protein
MGQIKSKMSGVSGEPWRSVEVYECLVAKEWDWVFYKCNSHHTHFLKNLQCI